MYKAKSRFGPAQQAYVLLQAFNRFKVGPGWGGPGSGSAGGAFVPLVHSSLCSSTPPAAPQGVPITRLVITGCPLPSINRIVERGLDTFPDTLQQLEVNECAFRGDNFNIVTRRIKKHPALQSIKVRGRPRFWPGPAAVRVSGCALARSPRHRACSAGLCSGAAHRCHPLPQVIQSGALKKYKNCRKDEVAALFKAKLSLKRIAICVPWWDAANMQRCAKVGGRRVRGGPAPLEPECHACSAASEFSKGAGRA